MNSILCNLKKERLVKFRTVENDTSTTVQIFTSAPVIVRVHPEIKQKLSNRREGNESLTDLKLPVCSPSSFLGNFFYNQLPESKAPNFMKIEKTILYSL